MRDKKRDKKEGWCIMRRSTFFIYLFLFFFYFVNTRLETGSFMLLSLTRSYQFGAGKMVNVRYTIKWKRKIIRAAMLHAWFYIFIYNKKNLTLHWKRGATLVCHYRRAVSLVSEKIEYPIHDVEENKKFCRKAMRRPKIHVSAESMK